MSQLQRILRIERLWRLPLERAIAAARAKYDTNDEVAKALDIRRITLWRWEKQIQQLGSPSDEKED